MLGLRFLFHFACFILFNNVSARLDRQPSQEMIARLLRDKNQPLVVFVNTDSNSLDGNQFQNDDTIYERKDLTRGRTERNRNRIGRNREQRLRTDEGGKDDDQTLANYEPRLEFSEPAEREAYLFYNLLRTTQAKENLDEEAERIFENTKDILSEALRQRCQKKASCEKKCPPKKDKCEFNCQKVFDELDACQEIEDPCKKKNDPCAKGKGKTMPPKWLRSLDLK